MLYSEFVKQEFHKLPKSLTFAEKSKKISEMWRELKSKPAKATKKGGSMVTGAGFLSDILDSVGLGLKMKHKHKM
jgi:hypothetical protein